MTVVLQIRLAFLRADTAQFLAVLHALESHAVVRIDRRTRRNRLRERNIDRAAIAEVIVEGVRNLVLLRTRVPAGPATGAFRDIDVTSLLTNRHFEVSDVSVDLLDLGVRHQLDIRMLTDFDHSRSQDALRAVESRERFG